jgi:RHS repeat-associated protein
MARIWAGKWLPVVGLVCCVVGSMVAPTVVLAENEASVAASVSLSLTESPLVVAGVQGLDEGQQVDAAEEVRLSSPVMVAEREASQTKFEGLDDEQARAEAAAAFPAVVDEPAGGPPVLSDGQKVEAYLADDAARVDLGNGQHGVVESLEPMAVESSPGVRSPLELSLEEVSGGFAPKEPVVGVHVPRQLSAGVSLEGTGVSLTPVDAQGTPLAGAEGVLTGASVFYGETGVDTGMIVKPVPTGFSEDTLLLSKRSPNSLFFRVGLPEGARLVQGTGSDAVAIVEGKATIATIPNSDAQDAAGSAVPVSMAVSGNVVSLDVGSGSGAYEYPIEVDPTVTDSTIKKFENKTEESNWREEPAPPSPFHFDEYYGLEDFDTVFTGEPYARGEWGAMAYETRANTHIYKFVAETSASNPESNIENEVFIRSPGKGMEKEIVSGDNYSAAKQELCVEAGCATGKVTAANEANAAEFKQTATSTGKEFDSKLLSASVSILQEKGPTVGINTTSKIIKGKTNIFYPGAWWGPRGGWYEPSGTDPGLGIDEFHVKAPGWEERLEDFGSCRGVQCQQSVNQEHEWHTSSAPPNGEDTVEVISIDPVGLTATTTAKVKVDEGLPYNFTISGLPSGNEFGNKQYALQATVQDGSGAVPSSGIESIKLSLDGKEIGAPSGSCAKGPCTATGEWTFDGSAYATGQHTLEVTATSNAGDVKTEKYTVYIGHEATPIAFGPGSVNPTTGEYVLDSTDFSLGSPGAALSVKRSYGSYRLGAGSGGPLGSQWSMSIGGIQSLTKSTEGSVVLTDAEGQASVFTSKGKGEFNSPVNSASLKLTEVLEGESTKEFLLTSASGAVTKFKLPSGGTGSTWVPSTVEGPGATNIVTYAYRTVGGVTEPTEVLGPVPAGVSCSAELIKGCRALGFVYATKTSATGDGVSEWGEYEGRLKEVTATAWNPAVGKMATTAVAAYIYDKEGKLRAEWDPRISPALRTTYGYDAAGRVTAITSPGEQPWIFKYGTSGDSRARLLSITRPSASTSAGTGQSPTNSVVPALSTTAPRTDEVVSVTSGTWSNSPLAYSYQWEDCRYWEPSVCTPITGATDQTYATKAGDKNSDLKVDVTATNSDGSTTVVSNESSKITSNVKTYERGLEFGKEGPGEGQLKKPMGVAVDQEGNVWVADTGNNRIEKFSSAGAFLKTYGSAGTGKLQFKEPKAIAIDSSGYVFVADSGNNRIEVLSSKGEYVATQLLEGPPAGVAVGGLPFETGERDAVYIALSTKNRIGTSLFSTRSHEFVRGEEIGSFGSGERQFNDPTGIALNDAERSGLSEAQGRVYVADSGNHRVQVLKDLFTSERFYPEFVTRFGSSGTENGQFSSPTGIAVEPENQEGIPNGVLVADPGNGRLQQFSEAYSYQKQYAEKEAQGIAISHATGKTAGDLYVANSEKSQITEWTPGETPLPSPEPPNPGTSSVWTVDYNVPVSGSEAPHAMGKTEVEAWGQKDDPTEATAIFPPDEPMGWPAKDYKRATIYYRDSNADAVNVATPGEGISTAEYNSKGDIERALMPDNRALALKEGSKSAEAAKLLDTENTYNAEGTELQSALGPQHNVKLTNGTEVQARGHTLYSYDEGAPVEGGPYGLPTKTTEGALYSGKEEDIRETITSYSGQGGLGWKLHKPTSVTTDPKGLKLTHTTVYEASTGAVKETVLPAGNPAEKTAHATETIYYTTAKNSTTPACGEHPEWANMPCETQPAKQPGTAGLPNLPVSTTTYNMWDEPEQTVEAVDATKRTKTTTYDGAGRPTTSATSSTVGVALPTVTDEYNTETGALSTQSTTTEGKTKKIASLYNSLGQLTSYTDADENTTTYTYDVDGRAEKVNDGKGTQTYSYDPTTGDLTKLVDSAAGTFMATYDPEGNLLTESYPNGMNANYAYNQTGMANDLEYVKTTHCTEKCTWFTDAIVPSIHGQWLSQTSTLSSQAYTYDADGRLTQVQSTPAGKGCTTRLYAYEEDTNDTSLTTREPGSKGECTTTGGAVEKHTYDPADRLTDSGAAYSTFGNITALPAADAGGTELTSAYYVDDQLQSQTQNGETIGYNLDPAGRTRETVSTGKTTQDIIDHYPAGGSAPSWTIETPSGNWTRNVQGIGGGLSAIQTNGGAPVLQLSDLHGDIVGTASLSETEVKPLSMTDTTEYGVPTTTSPAKYAWLGGEQQPTELASGVIAMGARSYVPQLGRFLQPDPIPGGSANAYTYTFGDPVNTTDPSGALTYGFSSWLKEANNQEAQEVAAREAAREALEREEAERRVKEAELAAAAAGPQYTLGGSAGWACEYAAETGQEGEGCGGGGGRFITYKGGPGATCGKNSTNHRKCHEPKGGSEKEDIEACAALGGAIGGAVGGAIGDLPGGAFGAWGGAKAAEEACKAA